MVAITCPSCGFSNEFEQPYAFHAGFANQGFLYNDAGNLTLVWSSYDPDYEAVVGAAHPWVLTQDKRALLEEALAAAPAGGRWRFANPARCQCCARPISGPITDTVYYLRYRGSLDLDLWRSGRSLKVALKAGEVLEE